MMGEGKDGCGTKRVEKGGKRVAFPFSTQTVRSELQDEMSRRRPSRVPRAREERIDPAHFAQGHARSLDEEEERDHSPSFSYFQTRIKQIFKNIATPVPAKLP